MTQLLDRPFTVGDVDTGHPLLQIGAERCTIGWRVEDALVDQLVQQQRIELTHRVERSVTYHDPCRLNKRKGVHKAPRELK